MPGTVLDTMGTEPDTELRRPASSVPSLPPSLILSHPYLSVHWAPDIGALLSLMQTVQAFT